MFQRIVSPIKTNSFFLFGPRGTGKTTFFSTYFHKDTALWIDLLNPEVDDHFQRYPSSLNERIQAQEGNCEWVVIDEVQKNPKLLNVVHQLIEKTNIKFALTGSSARKLKRDSSNLLAGRAFVNYLFPLTSIEVGRPFNLADALNWGTLPKLFQLKSDIEKQEFLRAYALTYLKEEIWAEHFIRKLDPFRRFLEVAGQTNGEIINYTNIARDVGVDVKTVQSYFEILEDTLLGFFLEPFHTSVRKQQQKSPKFYFCDIGIKKALGRMLTQIVVQNTYSFGKAFEHFIIAEIYRLNTYFRKDFRLFYLRTKDQAEIDLIIEKPDKTIFLIEIKSSEYVSEKDTKTLERFLPSFNHARAIILSRDPFARKIGNITIFPWQEGLQEICQLRTI